MSTVTRQRGPPGLHRCRRCDDRGLSGERDLYARSHHHPRGRKLHTLTFASSNPVPGTTKRDRARDRRRTHRQRHDQHTGAWRRRQSDPHAHRHGASGGRGVVTLDPTQTACQSGEQCTYTYAPSTVVRLQATPYSGSSFGGWTGCDIVDGTFCSLTMNGDRAVTATIN